MARLSLKNVSKRYESVLAVDDLSFEVTPGRIFGLLGPNGAGKTSAIRMIAHITAPDAGGRIIRAYPHQYVELPPVDIVTTLRLGSIAISVAFGLPNAAHGMNQPICSRTKRQWE